MRTRESLFYPEQVVTGRVVAMNDWFASIDIQGQKLPLENRFIQWEFNDKPSDLLMLGQRLQAVVHEQGCKDSLYRCRTLKPSVFWHGFWLDCLPLLDDPWPHFKALHPEGTVMELDFLKYINHYVAKARTESGRVVELMNSDLHPGEKSTRFADELLPYQPIKLVIRGFSGRTLRSKRLK